jgi:metallo-beta-lactamase family protein
MATGGRVLHHLKAMAPEAQHHIVFAGFQVGGSRGARLVGGATEVKIHGEYVPVRAR